MTPHVSPVVNQRAMTPHASFESMDTRVPLISYVNATHIPTLGIVVPQVVYQDAFQQQHAFQPAATNCKQPEYAGLCFQPWAPWIRHVAGLMTTYRVASVDQVQFLAQHVTFDLRLTLALAENQTLAHWFDTLTRQANRLTLSARDISRQLPLITQGDGTVVQFYERLRALRAQDPTAISDLQLVDQFDRGLNATYQLFMPPFFTPNPTLDELLDAALHVEGKLKNSNIDTRQSLRLHYKCKLYYHLAVHNQQHLLH